MSTAEDVISAVKQHCSNPSPKPDLIIMFTATWCGPCTLVAKELAHLAALRPHNSLKIMCCDVDEEDNGNSALASRYGIKSLPTLCYIGKDPAKPVISTVGAVSRAVVVDILDNKIHLSGGDLGQQLRLS